MIRADTLPMLTNRFRVFTVAPAIVLAAALGAGCGGSSNGAKATTTTAAPATTAAKAPASTTAKSPGSTVATGHQATPTTLPAADLEALKQQLDAAGSSLGAAGTALAQSDPNQTKSSEGTTP